MLDQYSIDLMNALSACASGLQNECIVKTGVIQIDAPVDNRRAWPSPPMRPGLEYMGINLNDFPRWLYGIERMDGAAVPTLWDEIVDALFSTRLTHDIVQQAIPGIPLVRSAIPTAPLVQLMCAIWWQGGRFEVSTADAHLRAWNRIYRIDQRTITHRKQQTRLPRGCQISPMQILRTPLGKSRLASPRVTATYQYLISTLPHLGAELNVIFATAVAAGAEFCERLIEMFDVRLVEADTQDKTLWQQARKIVLSARHVPNAHLWELMKGRMTYRAFRSHFGDPAVAPRAYTTLLRSRHIEALAKLESGEIASGIPGVENKVSKLLQLQQMMGPQ